MIHIKKFIDKVSIIESKQAKDVVIPIADARGLRDELSKLLADLYFLTTEKEANAPKEVIEIQVKGGSFK
jgi:hypothetical protein